MPLKATLESPLANQRTLAEGYVPDHTLVFWPDRYAGRIILAKYIDDSKGADIYMADGEWEHDVMPDSVGAEFIKAADFHKHLHPWVGIDLPIQLTPHYTANLKLLARPMIKIFKDYRMTSLSDE